ncbi:MAG TPA: M48 family metalloprotease, partial [Phycisphaerae bacterium]|nr:M48 family metalloprotease [Phycisphaerae bacterium]
MRRLATVHIAAAALAVLVGLLAGCEGGRSADRTGGSLLTVEEALQVGRAAAPYVETLAGGRFENLPVEAYLRTIGERVARSTPRHELPYQFAVIDSADVRGYALPGGPVYLTRGLLAKL